MLLATHDVVDKEHSELGGTLTAGDDEDELDADNRVEGLSHGLAASFCCTGGNRRRRS